MARVSEKTRRQTFNCQRSRLVSSRTDDLRFAETCAEVGALLKRCGLSVMRERLLPEEPTDLENLKRKALDSIDYCIWRIRKMVYPGPEALDRDVRDEQAGRQFCPAHH